MYLLLCAFVAADRRGYLRGGATVAGQSIRRVRLRVGERDVTRRPDRLRHRMSLQADVIHPPSRTGRLLATGPRRLVAPPPPRERGIAMSVSVRPSARLYVGLLENVFAMDFHTSFMHATCDRVSRSSSGGVATRYVLPVLLMTPCFPLWLCGAGPARGVLTHDDSP